MRKYAPTEVSSDSINDPLTKRCIGKINKAAVAAATGAKSQIKLSEGQPVVVRLSDASNEVILPMVKEENAAQTRSIVDRNHINEVSTSDSITVIHTNTTTEHHHTNTATEHHQSQGSGLGNPVVEEVMGDVRWTDLIDETGGLVSRDDGRNILPNVDSLNRRLTPHPLIRINPTELLLDCTASMMIPGHSSEMTQGANGMGTSTLQLTSFVQNDNTFLAFSTADGNTIAVDSSSLANYHPSGLYLSAFPAFLGVAGDQIVNTGLVSGQQMIDVGGTQRIFVLNTSQQTNGLANIDRRVSVGHHGLMNIGGAPCNIEVDSIDRSNNRVKLESTKTDLISNVSVSTINNLIGTCFSTMIIPS